MLFVWILLFAVSYSDSLSLGVKPNVTKREIDNTFFPDLVNKKDAAEHKEFIDSSKPKPKKRLALPTNFVMKAVVPESDDYYDKSQGDSDDYYEKKDWSDLHRSGKPVDRKKALKTSNITDIDGIVNIITKPNNDPVLRAIKSRLRARNNVRDKPKRQSFQRIIPKSEPITEKVKLQTENEENKSIENISDSKEDIKKQHKKESIEENDDEADSKIKENDEEGKIDKKEENKNSENNDADNEAAKIEKQRENEEKKAKILSSVDELKERHAKEQQSISEKVKEEEIFKEELDRELERTGLKTDDDDDKYAHTGSRPRWQKLPEDDDSSEESRESIYRDKYEIGPYKSATTSTTTTTLPPRKHNKQKNRKNKTLATGKLSVFRNPNAYTISDAELDTTTSIKPEKSHLKFSSKFSAPKEDNIRISLVPEDDSKEGEPTLFYPKKRKNKRKFKIKTTSFITDPITDSSEDTSDISQKITTPDLGVINGTLSSDAFSSASNTAPSDDVTAVTATDSALASTDKKEKKNSEDFSRQTGATKEHKVENIEEHDELGKKAYEGVHKDTKSNKGHHDKENHLDKYDDHGGVTKEHHEQDDHYGSHHHEEHGKKHAKYEESGKHSKGHSTKGSHDIHKKEEYEKKVEFFEEEGDSDEEEDDGGYHSEKEHKSGGHFKKAKLDSSYDGHSKGEKEHFSKGGYGEAHKGYKGSGGHDSHGKHAEGHHKSEDHSAGRKWTSRHGTPAKKANLVYVDRRPQVYQHGPLYYG